MRAKSLVVFVGIVLLCGTCLAENLVGKSAPAIAVRQWVTDNPPDMNDLAGRVRVFEFWATWCHACVKSIPDLIKLNNRYKEQGLEFIALSQDKSAETVRQFVRRNGVDYSVAIDNGTADWFEVKAYPTVVVVDHRGTIAWSGYPWSAQFEKAVAAAIQAAPPPLLAGFDLGPFSHLKRPLLGGVNFMRAYQEIQYRAATQDKEKSEPAKTILQTIDQRIAQRTRYADQLRLADPTEAYHIYADIVSKYDGVEATEQAKLEYLKLKDSEPIKRMLAAEKTRNR